MTWPRTLPALVTPFTDGGNLDVGAHRHNVTIVTGRGARGVLVGGSTGQGPYLEPGERAELSRNAREAAPDVKVLCGIFAESARQAVSQIQDAAAGGADAALVVTPGTLVRQREGALGRFFTVVADRSPIPMLLYNVPSVTAVELPVDLVHQLAAHPSIIGIKDSSGVSEHFHAWRELTDAGFLTFAGASRTLLDSGRKGARGAITASANYALADVSLSISGDSGAQARLSRIIDVVEAHGVPGTMYAAAMSGLQVGTPRAPLRTPSPDVRKSISAALEQLGVASYQPHRSQ